MFWVCKPDVNYINIYIYIKEFYWQNGDMILMNFGKKNLDLI